MAAVNSSSLDDLTEKEVLLSHKFITKLNHSLSFPADFINYFTDGSQEKFDWIFSEDHAMAYARAIEYDCVKNRGLLKTIQKLKDADIIPNDEPEEANVLRTYFNQARDQNNAIHLLLCILNTSFYKNINQYMATGNSRKVFDRLCHHWSGYYTGLIMKNHEFNSYRFSGTVYRGMTMLFEYVGKKYKVQDCITNKTYQSTSKSCKVAMKYISTTSAELTEVNVIMIYKVLDSRFALDLECLSKYPEEHEVMLLPGCLFEVQKIDNNKDPIEIHVEQILTHYA